MLAAMLTFCWVSFASVDLHQHRKSAQSSGDPSGAPMCSLYVWLEAISNHLYTVDPLSRAICILPLVQAHIVTLSATQVLKRGKTNRHCVGSSFIQWSIIPDFHPIFSECKYSQFLTSIKIKQPLRVPIT